MPMSSPQITRIFGFFVISRAFPGIANHSFSVVWRINLSGNYSNSDESGGTVNSDRGWFVGSTVESGLEGLRPCRNPLDPARTLRFSMCEFVSLRHTNDFPTVRSLLFVAQPETILIVAT